MMRRSNGALAVAAAIYFAGIAGVAQAQGDGGGGCPAGEALLRFTLHTITSNCNDAFGLGNPEFKTFISPRSSNYGTGVLATLEVEDSNNNNIVTYDQTQDWCVRQDVGYNSWRSVLNIRIMEIDNGANDTVTNTHKTFEMSEGPGRHSKDLGGGESMAYTMDWVLPTGNPTTAPPTRRPTAPPTSPPTTPPTRPPTTRPPTPPPTRPPTTRSPTRPPTTQGPTFADETFSPTAPPSSLPSALPSTFPSGHPTLHPSPAPTSSPTLAPTTGAPTTSQPSIAPTRGPTTPAPTQALPTPPPSPAPTEPGPEATTDKDDDGGGGGMLLVALVMVAVLLLLCLGVGALLRRRNANAKDNAATTQWSASVRDSAVNPV